MDRVTLIGLDFGSTTTSFLLASAAVSANCATGRMEFADTRILARPPPVFTPFEGDRIRLDQIEPLLDSWFQAAGLDPQAIFAGGAIVTGLAARQTNADALTRYIRGKIGDAVIATADDPQLESWLAFKGSAAALSRAEPDRLFLNLDIGGGTTNPALGRNGQVTATGCVFVGARHVSFVPGTYAITGVSEFGRAVLDELGIPARAGDTLLPDQRDAMLGYFVRALEALVTGRPEIFASGAGSKLQQVAFPAGPDADPVVTFSGGVGELIYAAAAGEPLPPTTAFGDLGIDLALAILASPRLARDVHDFVPETRGRATVQGLTLHSMDISGTTVFLPRPDQLPLRDLPVVGSLPITSQAADIEQTLQMGQTTSRGICLQIESAGAAPALTDVHAFGLALGAALASTGRFDAVPLVLLTQHNIGKAIGNYATSWGNAGHNLIVIDEIPLRHAQFVNIGAVRHGIVPVSFYGMR